MRVAIFAAALLAASVSRPGCGNGVTTACPRSDPSCWNPCAGKACGEPCRVCPPDDPRCVETAEAKACDAGGLCSPAANVACPHPDCVGKACGEACNPCGPSETCPTLIPSACDREGRCAGDVPGLCFDPCAGKACGESCRICPPEATDCMETAVVKACDAAGRCVPRTAELVCPGG